MPLNHSNGDCTPGWAGRRLAHDLDRLIPMSNPTLNQIIQNLPDGYSEVSYKDSRYGMTVQRFNDGKSVKVFAKELKGTDFISLNFYTSSSQDHLKPCEMSQEKVIDFLRNLQPICS